MAASTAWRVAAEASTAVEAEGTMGTCGCELSEVVGQNYAGGQVGVLGRGELIFQVLPRMGPPQSENISAVRALIPCAKAKGS